MHRPPDQQHAQHANENSRQTTRSTDKPNPAQTKLRHSQPHDFPTIATRALELVVEHILGIAVLLRRRLLPHGARVVAADTVATLVATAPPFASVIPTPFWDVVIGGCCGWVCSIRVA